MQAALAEQVAAKNAEKRRRQQERVAEEERELVKLERERADSEMMALTADHERRVAELFKKASVSR